MENYIDRIRARFSSFGQDDDVPVAKDDGEILPPKKIDNVGEGKKAENWFRRHFSGQARSDYDSTNGGDIASVLGAAAFAVVSLEEAEYQNKMKMREKPDSSLTNDNNRRENGTAKLPETKSLSRLFLDEKAKDTRSPGADSMKISDGEEQKIPRIVTNQKLQEKAETTRVPTTNKIQHEHIPRMELDTRGITRTSSRMELDTRGITTTSSISVPSPDATVTNADDRGKKRSPPSPGSKESKADIWKQIEMKRIRERYDKVMASTLSWEDKKKVQAKRHLERRERSIEKKRAKSVEHYRLDMITIEKVVGKVRTREEKRKQKEEAKANEEAQHIRLTGKVHTCCFCF